MPRFLHVANGHCTTNTITAAGLPGDTSIWADPLYEGPVPHGVSDAALVDVRAQWIGASAGLAPTDVANGLREWRARLADRDGYDELVLWFEHDLFDQLNLIQLLSWLRDHLPESAPVSLICIGSYPGHPSFKGLGELTPPELAPLFETRRPIERAQYALAAQAWDAFRQPTPEPLDRLRASDTAALPFLAAAIQRLLEEYPWTRDGLSRSERRLLTLAAGGPATLRSLFPRMHEGERAYFITDLSLMAMAEALANLPSPLLHLSDAAADQGAPPAVRVELTDAGRAVLAGERDRVALGDYDRWIGGVHLQRGAMWRWDDARQAITR